MRRGGWICGLCLIGCSFDTVGALPEATPGTTSTSDPATTTSTSDTTATPEPDTSTSSSSGNLSGEDTSGGEPDADTESSTGPSGSSETGDEQVGSCPSNLPAGWILCEDFEEIEDPNDHFSYFQGDGIGLGGPGLDSPTALEITHYAQSNWSGAAALRFGDGPPANNVARPDARFDEVWVRYHFRVADDWPVQGPGDMMNIVGYASDPAWATGFLARTSSPPSLPWIYGSMQSCISGSYFPCTGGDSDWPLLSLRYSAQGTATVFEQGTPQDWHCVVMHARLNSPGLADGELQVLVDDALDTQANYLDYRGTHDELSFNQITMPTYIEVPLQDTHRRWIDDVVVSAVALDCDDAT